MLLQISIDQITGQGATYVHLGIVDHVHQKGLLSLLVASLNVHVVLVYAARGSCARATMASNQI